MKITSYTVKKRLITTFIVIASVFIITAGVLFYRQIIQAGWLQAKANSQWTSDLTIAAKRGRILDANGNVLAQSASAKTIILRPGAVKEPDRVADELAEILGMDRDTVYQKATDKTKSEIWLKRQVEREAEEKIRSLSLAGVFFTEDTKRYYPYSSLAAQLLGFVSVDGSGQTGLELFYNSKLAGVNGRIIAETDKNGVELPYGVARYLDAQNGLDMVLTVDYVIQARAEETAAKCLSETGAESVVCIVMQPKTGAVYAMVNAPTFDLNDPPRSDMALLNKLTYNSALLMNYEPGSTFKIVTTAAALDSGTAKKDTMFYCAGYKIVDGARIKCWRTTPHGSETLQQGVCNSCNPVFMTLAEMMGKETFYRYIRAFGFGTGTQIDFNSEGSGIVTDEKYVTSQDLARIAFGQSVAVTPMQLITAASAAVNGGNLMRPYLVKEFRTQGSEPVTVEKIEPMTVRRVISEETSATMREILEAVVTSGGGKNAYIPGYRVGGKTGTAQIYENGKIAAGKHIASFIGFAPADDPQIIVLFIVNKPNVAVDFGSVVAAPYARIILEDSLRYLGVQARYTTDEIADYNKKVEVPDVRNKKIEDAVALLEEKGFYVLVSGDSGTITAQSPEAGVAAVRGTAVCITASGKSAETDGTVKVPDILGRGEDDAKKILTENGLTMLKVGNGKTAVYTTPQVGEKVPVGTVIIVEFH